MPEITPPVETRRHGYAPLVEVWRGETVESVHYGAIAVSDADGALIASVGDPQEVTFLRSAAKPIQALPLLEAGGAGRFGLTPEEIAVIAGSHGGEPFHLAAVRAILRKIGLDESALRCGAHAPSHRPAAVMLRRRNEEPSAIHHNCSGKHAGMLALAVLLGAPVDTYLDAGHPVQVLIRSAVESFAGLPPGGSRLAVDGCSAPTFAMPMASSARLYATLLAPQGPPERHRAAARSAVDAMRRHPEMVAGSDRLCTELMREASGLVAKIGAEGFYGLGWESRGRGIGVSLKISDGDPERARASAAIEALRQLGALPGAVAERLRTRFVPDPRNHRGLVVGQVKAVFDVGSPVDRPSGRALRIP
jgi:L-asparaginase II